jgi:hypothetical protein
VDSKKHFNGGGASYKSLGTSETALASSFEVSVITHTIIHTVGLLWTSDQPASEASVLKRQTSMPSAGFVTGAHKQK